MEQVSDVVILAILGIVGTVCGFIGKFISDWQSNKTKDKELAAQAAILNSGSDERLRSDMALRIEAQNLQIGVLSKRQDQLSEINTALQEKFYDVKLTAGIAQADIGRLAQSLKDSETSRQILLERVQALEVERGVLLQRVSELEKRLIGGTNGG
jgi:chromosome segregation ATPase